MADRQCRRSQARSKLSHSLFDKPLPQKLNSSLPRGRKSTGEIAVAEAARDDVFVDDITFPATDGYVLGATLFLPRGSQALS
jgi:hypothetical protein